MESITAQPARQQRRHRWLVKPRYQVFFAVVLVLFQVDVGLIYLAATQHHVRQVAASSTDLAHFMDADLWTSGLPLVVGLSLAMGLLVYLLGLRFSHQIVGPIPRLSATLQAMAQGDYSKRLKFRPGDALEELAEDVNRLAESLQRQATGAQPVASTAEAGLSPQPRPAAGVRNTAPAR